MNSWSASALEVGHRRCSRKLPPARNSKHVHTGLDEVHQNVPVHNLPYFQSTLDVPTSQSSLTLPVAVGTSKTPKHNAEGNLPSLAI
jgi:hypothetical protein